MAAPEGKDKTKKVRLIENEASRPPPAPPEPGPSQITVESIQERSWKTKLAWMRNLQLLAIIFIPVFLVWLLLDSVVDQVTLNPKNYKGLFTMLVMGFYYMFGCMPLPAVALLPIIMIPLLMIVEGKPLMNEYMRNETMMSFSTVLLALSAITSGLSQRLAVKILALSGTDFRKSHFLAVIFSILMSLWFPNTAVMMFMIDVLDKMGAELKEVVHLGSLGDEQMNAWNAAVEDAKKNGAVPEINDALKNEEEEEDEALLQPRHRRKTLELDENYPQSDDELLIPKKEAKPLVVAKEPSKPRLTALERLNEENDNLLNTFKMSLLHSIGISINIGSLFWPYCSTSSIILMQSNDPLFDIGVWLNFMFPLLTVMLPLTVLYLDFYLFVLPSCIKKARKAPHPLTKTCRTFVDLEASPAVREGLQAVFTEKYGTIGKLNSHEKGVLIVVTATAQLFFWTRPNFIAGWSVPFNVDVKVATIAMMSVLLSFIIPKCGSDMFRGPKKPTDKSSFTALLGWKIVQSSFPFGLMLLIGGSTALAVGSEKSEFNKLMADRLVAGLRGYNKECVLFVGMLLAFTWAFFISNTASSYIMISVMKQVASKLRMNRCYLTVPCVVVTSLAFIFPAGTPTLALLQIKTNKMDSIRCLRVGVPLAFLLFFIVYIFAVMYITVMIPCKVY